MCQETDGASSKVCSLLVTNGRGETSRLFGVWESTRGVCLKTQTARQPKSSCRSCRRVWAVAAQSQVCLIHLLHLCESSRAWGSLSSCACGSSMRGLKAFLGDTKRVERKWKRWKTDLVSISAAVCQITFWDSFLF